MKIGVLALQGAFREHREVLEALGATCVEVRTPEELAAVDALVLPGGESTTIDKLLDTSGVREPLVERLRDGLPAFGTCAGLIVLARSVLDGRPDQEPLDAIDVTVRRNAYGTQAQSFEADLDISGIGSGSFRGVFIRAPVITRSRPRSRCSPSTKAHRCSAVRARCGCRRSTRSSPAISGSISGSCST